MATRGAVSPITTFNVGPWTDTTDQFVALGSLFEWDGAAHTIVVVGADQTQLVLLGKFGVLANLDRAFQLGDLNLDRLGVTLDVGADPAIRQNLLDEVNDRQWIRRPIAAATCTFGCH